MSTFYRWLACGVLIASLALPAEASAKPEFHLYLIRHAEKSAESDDPGLTDIGKERSAWLAEWFGARSLATIWSSDYRRSRDTAAPTARALGKEIELYDPRQLEPFAQTLLERGETALVVGHSNTTPELAAILCRCTVPAMDETEHDRIYQVTVKGEERALEELDQRLIRSAE